MGDVYRYSGAQPAYGDRTRTLFGQTMGLVACTAGCFALGAYLGRHLSGTVAGRRGHGAVHRRLRGAGYVSRRDLAPLARVCFVALLALIVFGIVLVFVSIPHGAVVYSVLGLAIFAGLTMFDFQRLRRSRDLDSAPLIAASIFLDILNVFLFFLQILGRSD
jgi:hypothetical protein